MTTVRIPRTYEDARTAFRTTADRHGWARSAHPLAVDGPDGQPLTIDIAHSPGDDPTAVLVVLSGVHGVEGFIGSALQCDGIERMADRLPTGFRVVMVHAVNPWGMAWLRRQNESNVDLNRNWGRDRAVPAHNDGYEQLHDLLCPSSVVLGDTHDLMSRVSALIAEHGLPWVEHAIAAGQRAHPDGMHFTGDRTEEGNRVLEREIPRLLRGATTVQVVDLHTGEGRRGTVTRLTDALPGRVGWGVVGLAPWAHGRAVTVEFGTVSNARQLRAARDECWVHHHGDRSDPAHRAAVHAYLECFSPDDDSWEAEALHLGRAELDEAAAAALRPTSSWLGQRGIDGGIDEVPLPIATGRLSLCGKHAIGPDPEGAMRRAGATTVVCLVEEHELSDRYPRYVEWLRSRPDDVVWFPVHDLHAPTVDAIRPLLRDLVARLQRGEHLLVHCAAGIGRSGTLAVCLLMALGMAPDDALEVVARARPMAGPEVGAQRDLIAALATG